MQELYNPKIDREIENIGATNVGEHKCSRLI